MSKTRYDDALGVNAGASKMGSALMTAGSLLLVGAAAVSYSGDRITFFGGCVRGLHRRFWTRFIWTPSPGGGLDLVALQVKIALPREASAKW